MNNEQIDNLKKKLEQIDKLDRRNRPLHKKLYKIYSKYANELNELLIQEGKLSGRIDDKMEQEIRSRLKKVIRV